MPRKTHPLRFSKPDTPQLVECFAWIDKNRPEREWNGLKIIMERFAPGIQLKQSHQHLRDRHMEDAGQSRLNYCQSALLTYAYVHGPRDLLEDPISTLKALDDFRFMPEPMPTVGLSSPIRPRRLGPQSDQLVFRRNRALLHFFTLREARGEISKELLQDIKAHFEQRKKCSNGIERPHRYGRRVPGDKIDLVLHALRIRLVGKRLIVMDGLTRVLRANHGRLAPLFISLRCDVVRRDGKIIAIRVRDTQGKKWYTPYFVAPEDADAVQAVLDSSPYQKPTDVLFYYWDDADYDNPTTLGLNYGHVRQALITSSQGILPRPMRAKDFRVSGHAELVVDDGLSDLEMEAFFRRAPGTRMTQRYIDVLAPMEMHTWMARIRDIPTTGPAQFHDACRNPIDAAGNCASCHAQTQQPLIEADPRSKAAQQLAQTWRRNRDAPILKVPA